MKRGLRLLLLIGALALCVAGYFLVGKLVPDETAAEETNAAEIEIASLDSAALARIDYTRGGETVALKKSGDSWIYESDPACPLDQTLVKQMVSVSTSLTASRSFTSQDLAEYGLDQPACSILLTDAGGGKKSFALGDRNEVTLEYYLTADGGDTVYLVDAALYDAFDKGGLDLVQKEAVPNMDNATRLSIERPDGALTLSLAKTADSSGGTGTDGENAAGPAPVWYLEQPGAAPATLDTAKVTELLSELTQLAFRKCVRYNAADIDLAEYGLDEPAATVTVTYPAVAAGTDSGSGGAEAQPGGASATFTLALGDVFGEDYRCARLIGSKMVYLIDESAAQKLLSASWDTLRPDAE